MELLKDHIEEFYRTQKSFALAWGVTEPQVSSWIEKKWRIEGDILFSPVRDLNEKRQKLTVSTTRSTM